MSTNTLYTFITGPDGAGKSSFLLSLGEPDTCWLDEEHGLECRRIAVDEVLDVILFCPAHGTHFDELMSISERDLLGYIAVVDSTDQSTWEEAQRMVETCRGYALLPMVIAANKQDQPGAAAPEALAEAIGMNVMTHAKGLVATNADSARGVFLELLYSVRQEIERLDRLIEELERLAENAD